MDKTFPANEISLTGGLKNIDADKVVKRVTNWKRVSEICSKPKLFINGTEAGDVCQGGIGDCWFIGAMSVVATKPLLMVKIFFFF